MIVKCAKCSKKYERIGIGSYNFPYLCDQCKSKSLKLGFFTLLGLFLFMVIIPMSSAQLPQVQIGSLSQITSSITEGIPRVNIEIPTFVKVPYWTGYDNSTQNFLNVANTQVVNISNNNDVDKYLIDIVGNQNITFQQTGDYLCELSPEFYQTTGTNRIITFWIQKNGIDVPWSNSRFTIINQQYMAPSINYQFDIENPATDNIRFMWYSDSTGTQIISISGLTLPTRPSIPGILLNCMKVSELTP